MATTPKTTTVEVEVTTRTLPHVQHPDLPTALAAFQAEVPTIRKGNEAKVASQKGSYTYQYADLSDVTEKTLPLLGKHGLSFTAVPTQTKHGFVLKYALRHESGGIIDGTYPLPPANTTPQQLGSSITYARRYALTAVTGVAPGGDDEDAYQAPPAERAPRQARQQRPAAKAEPSSPDRDWLGEAEAADDKEAVGDLWRELKAEVQAGRANLALLDRVAAVGRKLAAAEAPDDAPAEPTDVPVDAAEVAA